MNWKVLISSSHMQSRLYRYKDMLDAEGIVVDLITRPQFVPEADLIEIVEPYHAIVCSDDEITDRVLEKAKNLKLISKWGVGINSIDRDSAKRRGIEIYNSPGAFSESCATQVFAYMLHFARRIADQDRAIREGKWEHITGMALAGKTLGIIGMGAIGHELKKRADAFGMRVIATDIKDLDYPFMVSLETLLKESDFISLNCDLNPTSHHLINRATLAHVKKGSYLINTARGPVVDESALVEALEDGRLAGAGLDVFENEPIPQDSPLRHLPNVVLTPHNAYNTTEAEDYVHDNTMKNLIQGLKKVPR